MSTYWGDLPAPKITRTLSGREQKADASELLTVDTNTKGNRLSGQSISKHNRNSVQTNASIPSTFIASPTTSSFRGGLAPRPASFNQSVGEAYIDKRRQREARNREFYDETPPPAAPDAPRPPPPVSYKQPASNGASASNYAAPTRSRSTRKPEGPVSPDQDYFGDYGRSDYPKTSGKSGKAKAVDRGAGRSISEADEKRHREWAAARSPLQRLESTLDSITKEEKRARVEEAELLAREGRVGPTSQNSVRFRNRPVAKASELVQDESQKYPEDSVVRKGSNATKEQIRTAKGKEPLTSGILMKDDRENPSKSQQESVPQRGKSVREPPAIPMAIGAAAGGLVRSTSNKLKKDPPGDPWSSRRANAENTYREVIAPAGHSRGPSLSSHPQVRDKALPSLPKAARAPAYQINNLDLGTEQELDMTSVRRENIRKAEQLTGERGASQISKPVQSEMIARRTSLRQSGKAIGTEMPTGNGVKYAVSPAGERKTVHQTPEHHRLSNVLHHKHQNFTGQTVYTPTRRLDEWKNGGVALLDGTLLELDAVEKTEEEKDRAWWEAGNKGKRRRSSTTKERKAVAYDGEFDDSNGTVTESPTTVECEVCEVCEVRAAEQNEMEIRPKRRIGLNDREQRRKEAGKSMATISWALELFLFKVFKPPATNPSLNSLSSHNQTSSQEPNLIEHLLTCPTRAIRVRPHIAPTRFKPKLFLKCGPLLRYCGLRCETKQGRISKDAPRPEREIWRGSVMIVTHDSHSSYELAPTLRLFLQPVDLMPPPPEQFDGAVEELAPEYVDPIGGLPKIGRDGRTLYVRPVDSLEEGRDLSKEESDEGLYEATRSPMDGNADAPRVGQKNTHYDGERAGKYKEIRGFRIHAEYGVTFWKFNLEVELRETQQRIAYRINRGPATGFWVPARGQAMNIMFHSCNGFSHGVDSNAFSGPDPMWRDVLNTHQTQPFHVMLGGGDQIYNDSVQHETSIFEEWTEIKDQHEKERQPFTLELQEELEKFYLNRYSMWFSQGLFSLANAQIPMINIYDDHDIIDGFGSYSDRYMKSPVMSGLGAVAFKYYLLFQHQSSIDEGEDTEPTWVLGTQPGPFIQEMSRSILTFLGRSIAFLGIDCRTERMFEEVVSPETYDKLFARLEEEIVQGETKHLIVLLGVPIAYPRMVWLETLLTSRFMEPVKALSRAGVLGKGLLNHLDGGVEILDDLDDHWTAKHHKDERNFLIEELQELAAEKSVRITILGGDVHLGAIGQFYSNPRLGIPKDRDHRYMPNVVSSAIVNTPPPDALADLLNKRNKVHHLDQNTDEDMIPIFTRDVNGKPRNNKRLLNRRNWCSIREYNPELTPPPSPGEPSYDGSPSPPVKRGRIFRRFSRSGGPTFRPDAAVDDRPPVSNTGFFSRRPSTSRRSTDDSRGSTESVRPGVITRTLSLTRNDFMPSLFRRNSKRRTDDGGINGYGAESDDDYYYEQQNARSGLRGGGGDGADDDGYFPTLPQPLARNPKNSTTSITGNSPTLRRGSFHRTPTGLSQKQLRRGGHEINLEGGLDISLHMEVNPKDPAGITVPYRLLVPQLWYDADGAERLAKRNVRERMKRWRVFARKGKDAGRWHHWHGSQSAEVGGGERAEEKRTMSGARGL